jgi:hypothetical protein
MSKTVAVIALTLAVGIGTPAKTHHHHQQEAAQGVAGNISDTDARRHFLLYMAADMSAPDPSQVRGDKLTILNGVRNFRTEFEKAIDDFNASQENRIEADQIAALNSFISQRDAMVESYWKELNSMLTPQKQTELAKMVEASKSAKIPTYHFTSRVGENCGLPNDITCSITYSILGNLNANRGHNIVLNQILDGSASMVGNSQHARHTPTVTVTISGTQHNNSGKSVCADCYIYVNANVSFVMVEGVQYEVSSEGIVVCSEAAKFFDTSASAF